MKLSRYNIYTKNKNDIIIYNSISGSVCSLTKPEFSLVKKSIKNNISNKIIDNLVENNIIVDNYDELEIIRYNYKMLQFDKTVLSLTICPTMDCNFRCPYCFESRQKGNMSEEDEKILLDFVDSKIDKSTKTLDVLWFGGEPLLGFKTIERLSRNFLDICKQKKLDYRAYIISNGYLINEKIVEAFKEYKINGIQITIDGPKQIHNQRRVLQNNIGTYDTILKNVKLLLDNNIKVTIRVNIDKTNYNLIEELFKDFKDKNLQNVTFAFGHIIDYTENCKAIACNCLTKKEYSKTTTLLNDLLEKYGLRRNDVSIPENVPIFCDATKINSFSFDHKLNIYRCWNEIGMENLKVGNLKSFDPTEVSRSHERKYILWDPTSQKCSRCKYLPLCMGGCPYLGIKTGKHQCEKWKYLIKGIINRYIKNEL